MENKMPKYNKKVGGYVVFEKDGETLITNDGTKGGYFYGDSHQDHSQGISAIVDNEKPILVEGNEVIINKKSVQSDKVLTVKGTPKEILSTINQLDGNGVAIGDEEAEILAKYRTGGKVGESEINKLSVNEFEEYLEKKYNSKVELGDYKKYIYLSRIDVPKEIRNLGIGSEIMSEIIDYADYNDKKITLTPSTDYGATSISRLKEFYKKFGFIENKGKNKDFEISQLMYRVPVNEKYHLGGDMSKHLAPNGKPSNLTHEQWHLVRSPEFKAWFGDWENDPANSSKVVDENGEPLVVYHGTDKQFNVFKKADKFREDWGIKDYGMYFTDSIYTAEYYSYERIDENKEYEEWNNKLNELKKKEDWDNWAKLYEYGKDKFKPNKAPINPKSVRIIECFLNIKKPFLIDGKGRRWFTVLKGAVDISINNKNDGIIASNTIEVSPDIQTTYVAFEPNQIKLADGTNTTFDGNNPDIRFEGGGEIEQMIKDGSIDLKLSESIPEHAEIYGLKAEKPLFVQNLIIDEKLRLKVLEYIDSVAKRNGNDVIFGHINNNNTLTNKSWLQDNGYSVNEDNNDFYKVVIDNKFKTGGSIKPDFSKMSKAEIKEFYNSPEGKKLDAETYSEWKKLVNMSKSELKEFYNSPEGKKAGLTPEQASEQGIDSGRESARWIFKMKSIPYKLWSSDMWIWAKKQISFIKRMTGMKGDLYDENGNKTRKHTALLIWGNNPEKKYGKGGGIESEDPKTYEEIREYSENILKEFNPRYSAYSDTNGQSMYFNVGSYENPIKVRFSDHSVTNIDRISNEVHFSLRNVNSEYTKFMNEQKILELRYRLGDDSIVNEKREMLMPSGKLLQGFGYSKKYEQGGGIEIKNNKNMNKNIQPEQKDLFGGESENQLDIFKVESFAKGGEISTSNFYAKKVVSNWNEIPSTWKNTSKVAKVNLKFDPKDSKFNSVFQNFLSIDQLRPAVTGFNVDEYGITATNLMLLVTIPTTENLEKGIFLNGKEIEGKYPNYDAVIPKQFDSIHKFDCYKLLQYCRVSLNYCNKITKVIALKVEDSLIGFNAQFLIDILETSLKLGYDNLYFHFSGSNRAGVFSPIEKPTLGTDLILVLMPVMLNNIYEGKMIVGTANLDLKLELNCYFDFNKNEIINSDGSVVDFKMEYGENPIFTKQVVKVLKENIDKKSSLPILENFKVEDNKATIVNMTDDIYDVTINDINAPEGLYFVKNDVAVYNLEDIEDYPKIKDLGLVKNKITIDSDYLKWLLETLDLFKGNDDLRPVMKGLSIIYDGYGLNFVSTDAHKLARIKDNDSIDLLNDEKFNIILPFNKISDLLKLSENNVVYIIIYDDYATIKGDKFESNNRLIDGRFPNYNAVIPYESKNKLTLNKEQLLKALATKEADNFIKKHKKETLILGRKESDNLVVSLVAVSQEIKDFSIIDSVDILTTELNLDEESYKSTTETCILLMPVQVDGSKLFAFNLKLFKDFIKPITSNSFDLNYREVTTAYIVNSNDFGYNKKIQKLKAVKKEVEIIPDANKTLLQSAIDKDKNWVEKIYKENSIKELDSLIDYLKHTPFSEELKEAYSRRNYVQRHELDKGTEHEMEHLDTLKKVAEHEITPKQAVVETAKTHIEENPEYYEDLAKMEKEKEESMDFDFSSLFEPSESNDIDNDLILSEEQKKEEIYQKSSFDKKWASTRKEAIEKLLKQYTEAENSYKDWSSRQYKQNKSTVFLGGDDVYGQSKSIGGINEGRKQKALKRAESLMKESISDLKEIGLSSSEIDYLINKDKTEEQDIPKMESENETYTYALTIRPFDIGTYPKENFIRLVEEEDNNYRFGLLEYSEPLNDRDIQHYSLAPVSELLKYNGVTFDYYEGNLGKANIKKTEGNIPYVEVDLYDKDTNELTETYDISGEEFLRNIEKDWKIVGGQSESEESIPDLIEGLKVLAESLEGAEKKEVEDTIEGLEILLESDSKFEKGGEILWATKIGEPDYNEQLITENSSQIENAKKWAIENGFDRIRVSTIDMSSKPDFKKGMNKFAEGGSVDNNTMIFEPSKADQEEEKTIMENQFGKNI
jgi:DNA polymerase III sliding clamp (beta) subunit (PCNA family)/GNAT superfamily N-acetyltransferase